MKHRLFKTATAALALGLVLPAAAWAQECAKPRLVIMADMGNEPDEEQQMMHMLLYSNMFDLEGLIAVSGKYLHSGRTGDKSRMHSELFTKLVDGYAAVRPNLLKHADNWPEPDYLKSITKSGTAEYGANAIGDGKSNEASTLIVDVIKKDDPRNIYFVANAGTNTLGQALFDLEKSASGAEMEKYTAKIFVFGNGAQDDSGAWIMRNYPGITWYRSNHQTYAYGGEGNPPPGPYTWEPYARTARGQHEWAEEHIMKNHGALGRLFPYRFREPGTGFLEGGGTTPWMGLANHGLFNPWNMWWGGWSGRVSRNKHKNVWSRHPDVKSQEQPFADFYMYEADSEEETWTDPVHNEKFTGRMVPVWRFRRAMWNDFRGRMDWCVKPFAEANHNPVAAVNGDKSDRIITMRVKPGMTLNLDAADTEDPDGDEMTYQWWVYKEAGTYSGNVTVTAPTMIKTQVKVPSDADGKEIHVILEVQDNNKEIGMYDYRRVVLDVSSKHTVSTGRQGRQPMRASARSQGHDCVKKFTMFVVSSTGRF